MDEKILEKVAKLLQVYGCDEEEINNFITDLKEEKEEEIEDIFEDEEDEEFNTNEVVYNNLKKDFDLDNDKDLDDYIKGKLNRK